MFQTKFSKNVVSTLPILVPLKLKSKLILPILRYMDGKFKN